MLLNSMIAFTANKGLTAALPMGWICCGWGGLEVGGSHCIASKMTPAGPWGCICPPHPDQVNSGIAGA